jgi:hypothetical protein
MRLVSCTFLAMAPRMLISRVVIDIAGRLYSGLDSTPWGMQIQTDERNSDPNGTSSADRILSLGGKVSGKKALVPATTWVGT